MADRKLGTIMQLFPERGYGWAEDDDREQYFFHVSSLPRGVKISDLKIGGTIRFKPSETTKGKRAISVEVL